MRITYDHETRKMEVLHGLHTVVTVEPKGDLLNVEVSAGDVWQATTFRDDPTTDLYWSEAGKSMGAALVRASGLRYDNDPSDLSRTLHADGLEHLKIEMQKTGRFGWGCKFTLFENLEFEDVYVESEEDKTLDESYVDTMNEAMFGGSASGAGNKLYLWLREKYRDLIEEHGFRLANREAGVILSAPLLILAFELLF